jgi:hypothetical protein
MEKLNSSEKSLIEQFQLHLIFKHINEISWRDLLEILIQRRYFSLSIVNTYEFVIDSLYDEQIKKTVRGILNEEYPRNTRGIPLLSHRELLFQDLLNLGATREMILTTPETTITLSLIHI